tara:strand:- start:396 stop:611 length:216 start_codon:yes stop_codon:yes gene_type:complete
VQTLTKELLISLGGKQWIKNSMDRVYINAEIFNELFNTSFSDKTNKFFFDCNNNSLMRSYKGKKPQLEGQY